jgi:hypothetical protein
VANRESTGTATTLPARDLGDLECSSRRGLTEDGAVSRGEPFIAVDQEFLFSSGVLDIVPGVFQITARFRPQHPIVISSFGLLRGCLDY